MLDRFCFNAEVKTRSAPILRPRTGLAREARVGGPHLSEPWAWGGAAHGGTYSYLRTCVTRLRFTNLPKLVFCGGSGVIIRVSKRRLCRACASLRKGGAYSNL